VASTTMPPPDGEDRRVRGAAGGVHDDAAAFAHRQATGAGQFVAGADAGGEDHHLRPDRRSVAEGHLGDRAVRAGVQPLQRGAGVDRQPQLLDVAAQHGAAALVQLARHQPGRRFHHVHVDAQALQRPGRLQAQQAPADHHAGGAGTGGAVGAQRLQVVDGAVDEHAGQVPARHRGHERGGAGGQHQRVVADDLPRGGGDRAGRAVDAGDRFCGADRNLRVMRGKRQVRLLGQVGGERDPVVGGAGFLPDHGDPP